MNRGNRYSEQHIGDNVAGTCNNDPKTIYRPTHNVVRTRTNRRTKRIIHPTHITNVHRKIVRVENFYPVTESNVNETIVEEYDCGTNVNRPNCQRVHRSNSGNCNQHGHRNWF